MSTTKAEQVKAYCRVRKLDEKTRVWLYLFIANYPKRLSSMTIDQALNHILNAMKQRKEFKELPLAQQERLLEYFSESPTKASQRGRLRHFLRTYNLELPKEISPKDRARKVPAVTKDGDLKEAVCLLYITVDALLEILLENKLISFKLCKDHQEVLKRGWEKVKERDVTENGAKSVAEQLELIL